MKALITGASSGFGWDMAHILSDMGYDIIAVARRRERLENLKKELKTDVEIVVCDLSVRSECMSLESKIKECDILVNNAGFGVFGDICSTDLNDELKMIDTNICALHILTKMAVKEFKRKNSGYILNVASVASFFPGPLFSAYYGTKAYVLTLTQSVAEELRRDKSNVKICALCPGPVETEFEKVAKVSFGTGKEVGKSLIMPDSKAVARYAIKNMFKGKEIIVPGLLIRIASYFRKLLPDKLLARIMYTVQSNKIIKR